jgi:hypothetical protein
MTIQTGISLLTSRRSTFIHYAMLVALFGLLLVFSACEKSPEKPTVRARSMADVPAQRLGYSFEADTEAPPGAQSDKPDKLAPVQDDFDKRRKDERLVRTVPSPDGERVLALYEVGEDTQGSFRMDMYSKEGAFLRNVLPPELSGAFSDIPHTVAWSPDGAYITIIARKSLKPPATPTPPDLLPEEPSGSPSAPASPLPIFAPVPAFDTEQVYICNRDGYDLRPLTKRDGLIYFSATWAPDGHAIASLACKELEWDAREKEFAQPQGRPRLIGLDGVERLLDDALTEALPVWSPDSSKVATAFDSDVAIYDAGGPSPTGARISLRDALISASAAYDDKNLKSKSTPDEKTAIGKDKATGKDKAPTNEPSPSPSVEVHLPVSFNPILTLYWPEDQALFVQTAYVRTFPDHPVRNFPRWHELHLSLQAATVSKNEKVAPRINCLSRISL